MILLMFITSTARWLNLHFFLFVAEICGNAPEDGSQAFYSQVWWCTVELRGTILQRYLKDMNIENTKCHENWTSLSWYNSFWKNWWFGNPSVLSSFYCDGVFLCCWLLTSDLIYILLSYEWSAHLISLIIFHDFLILLYPPYEVRTGDTMV